MTIPLIATPLASIKFPLTVTAISAMISDLTAQHGDSIVMRQYGSHIVAFTEGEVCGCAECRRAIDAVIESFYSMLSQGMVLCSSCGNKRCPHAISHKHVCTRSNEPGQAPELLPEYKGEQ